MDLNEDWLSGEDGCDGDDSYIGQFDLMSTPIDLNVENIIDFIEAGVIKIPGFQRDYVWDIHRASKFVESLIIGLPVPQIFLYEDGRNSLLVIDGQQRLMTIYFFVKERFPRMEKRAELRRVFGEFGHIPDELLHDDNFFEDFKLRLAEAPGGRPNEFAHLDYSHLDSAHLGEYRSEFDLRPIRNIFVKRLMPSDDDSPVCEIFRRLNAGGVGLAPQEIRARLYNSKFYAMLSRANVQPAWRALLGVPEPDANMRDIEIMLRAVAVWKEGDRYTPSMAKFLNKYSKLAKSYDENQCSKTESSILWFLEAAGDLPRDAFSSRADNKFSTPLFEAVFAATCRMRERDVNYRLLPNVVEEIKEDPRFRENAETQTTSTAKVKGRLEVASEYVERRA
jgi:hypothetical protein